MKSFYRISCINKFKPGYSVKAKDGKEAMEIFVKYSLPKGEKVEYSESEKLITAKFCGDTYATYKKIK